LPEEYEKCLVGLNAITKEAWDTAHGAGDKREKIQALSLAKECYSMKLELLTNATVVDDAIRFVSQKGQVEANTEPKANNNSPLIDIEERKHHDDDHHQNHEQELDDHDDSITSVTTNQIF
jgi:hypothetical protein